MAEHYQIDKLDISILSILMADAQRPFTDIAKEVFVSPGTVHVRVKKLKEIGIITGSQLTVDASKLGYGITAFIGIYLEKSSMFDSVVSHLKSIPEVVACHYTTGNYSMFLRIICRNTDHLKEVLHDKMQPIAGISRTETLISLEESINRPILLSDADATE